MECKQVVAYEVCRALGCSHHWMDDSDDSSLYKILKIAFASTVVDSNGFADVLQSDRTLGYCFQDPDVFVARTEFCTDQSIGFLCHPPVS